MYSLQDISIAFDGQQILDGNNLQVPNGEVTILIDKNGSGKTALLRIAAGYRKGHGR